MDRNDHRTPLSALRKPRLLNDYKKQFLGPKWNQRSNQLWRLCWPLILLGAIGFLAWKVSEQSKRIEQLERQIEVNYIWRK